MARRSVALIRNVTEDATTGATVDFTPPAWADVIVLHVGLTDVGASTTPSLDATVYQENPDSSGTDIAVPSASIDALTAAGNAFVAFGPSVSAVSGTGYDAVPGFISRSMNIVFTQDRGDADEVYTYKAWLEFIGYGKR